jgi:phosphate acyltransferase
MKIILDAMGSDTCPVPDVEGAVQAARAWGDTIVLVGDKTRIEQELAKYDTNGLMLEVVHADQTIDMHDKPSQVSRTKRDSSMYIGLQMVKDGKGDAFVSAGNTGAILALATLSTLKRVPGVKRPTLTALIRLGEKMIVLTDLGANADAKPDWLLQFGLLSSIYAERVMGQKNPRVALLSNGEEEGKGNELIKEARPLFEQSGLNFIGNVEPKEMLRGEADVIVADGFVGNITLKTLEALSSTLFDIIRTELTSNLITKIGAAIIRPAFRRVYKQLDPFETGGAPLLGVNGVVIVGHGRTNAKGIKNAIYQARRAVEGKYLEAVREGMAKYVHEADDAAE